MEYAIDGKIEFVEVPHLRSVQKFVRKRIAQWVGEWKSLHGESINELTTFFYVRFEKIGSGHQIFCTIQLMIGKRMWRGTALASGLHRALIHSMGHLNVRFASATQNFKEGHSDERDVTPAETSTEYERPRHLRLVR